MTSDSLHLAIALFCSALTKLPGGLFNVGIGSPLKPKFRQRVQISNWTFRASLTMRCLDTAAGTCIYYSEECRGCWFLGSSTGPLPGPASRTHQSYLQTCTRLFSFRKSSIFARSLPFLSVGPGSCSVPSLGYVPLFGGPRGGLLFLSVEVLAPLAVK